MKSLRHRLNRGLAAVLVGIFALHWLAADWFIRYVAETQMQTRLEHDGDSLLASVSIDAKGFARLKTERVGLIYDQPFSGHYYVFQADGELLRSPSLAAHDLATPALTVGGQRHYHTQGPENQTLLALQRAFNIQGQAVTLTVAEDLTDINRKLLLFRLSYLGLTIVIMLAAILLQSADVRRALRPLTNIRGDLEAVASGQKARIEGPMPAEIQPLVSEINRLLLLVERRLHQSRTAIGNLAHALKTPLAILYRIPGDPLLSAHPELRRELQEQTTAIHNRIERELKRARLSGNTQAGSNFNPQIELFALADLLHKVYAEKHLTIELSAPNQLFNYDREDMLELLGNLADNACKWAASRIRLTITGNSNALTIKVADDGPGVAEDELQDITQRGLRLDESQPGHGLGLAIVRDIVAFYSGELRLKQSADLGGLEITISF